jgi:hypothetical protein
MTGHRLRICVFVLVCVALTLVAIGSRGGGERQSSTASAYPPPLADPGTRIAPRLDPRPFLHAFLRYEVGELDPALRRCIRATSTRAFADQLLSEPVRSPPHQLDPARIEQLTITDLSQRPPRALVSGTATRVGKPEQFSFLFEATEGLWFASGPAE